MSTPTPSPTIKRMYGVDYCLLCGLALIYCRCGTTPAADPDVEKAEQDLVRRVREARVKAGGR